MALHISKPADLRYPLMVDHWKDVIDLNLTAQVYGKKGLEHFLKACGDGTPKVANRELVRCVDDFIRTNKAPQQKNAAYQVVVTFDKSFSVWLAIQTPEKQKEVIDAVTKIAAKELGGMCDKQYIRRGEGGHEQVTSWGFGWVTPQVTCSRGSPHFHLHAYLPNLSFADPDLFGAIGNSKARIYDLAEVGLARIQKGVNDYLVSKGVATELAADGKHVRVSGLPQKALDNMSFGKQAIERIMKDAADKGHPMATRFAALWAHCEAKRQGTPSYTVAERSVYARIELEQHGMKDVDKLLLTDQPRPGTAAQALAPDEQQKVQYLAYDVVSEAFKKVVAEHGFFTARQLKEAAYLGGIGKTVNGKPLPTVELARNAEVLLKSRQVERHFFGHPETGVEVKFAAKETPEVMKRSFLDRAFEVTSQAVEKGKEVIASTTFKLKDIAASAGSLAKGAGAWAASKVVTPKVPPPEIRLTADQVNDFVRKHTRMSKRKAVWKAYWEGRARPGRTVADKIANMRWKYFQLRRKNELVKGTHIKVTDGNNLTDARTQNALKKLCRRDGCRFTLEGREAAMPKPEPSKQQQQQQQEHTRYQFRGPGREKERDTHEK